MAEENLQIDTKFTVDNDSAIRNVEALDRSFEELRREAVDTGNRIHNALAKSIPTNLGGGGIAALRGQLSGLGNTVRTEAGSITSSMSGMSPAGGKLASLGMAAGPVGAAIGAAAGAMVGAAFAAGAYADKIDDTATSLNVTTGFLQKQSAAVALAGGSADAFDKGMGKMNLKIGEAATGNKSAQASFKALGVDIYDAQGKIKGNEQVFGEVREKLSGLESDTVRLAAANDIFGKGSKDLSGILKMNASDYDALIGEVSQYGVANDAAIVAAGKLGDATDLMGDAMKAGVINSFAPLTSALGEMTMGALPAVGKAFKFLGEVIGVMSVPLSITFDALSLVRSIILNTATAIGKAIMSFGPLAAAFKSTGEAGTTFRDRYVNVLQTIVRGSVNMAATVVGRFTELSAQVRNIGASIANFAVDMGLAGIFGIKGKIELVDPVAEGKRAEAAIRAGGEAAIKYLETKRAKVTPDRVAESGGTTAGYDMSAAGGGATKAKEKASEAAKAAADAEKKYADEVKKLEAEIKNLTLTTEQKVLADKMEAAGLSRDITQIGEKADKIRELNQTLQDGEKSKKVGEVIADLAEKARDAGRSVDELAKVEARRRAGLPADLAINNALTASLDAQAVATLRAANAKQQAESIAGMTRGLEDDEFALKNNKDAKRDPIGAGLAAEKRDIEQRRQARLKDIEAMGLEADAKSVLIARTNELAAAEAAAAGDAAVEDKADVLSGRIMGIFTDAEQAKEQFFTSLIAYLVEASLKALLLGENMAGAAGGGGGIGGFISGAIGAALGFGGGRAAGGSVRDDEWYLVGENGPEILAGTSGTVIPNHKIGSGTSSGSSGGMSIHAGQNTFIIQGGNANEQTLAEKMSREQERTIRKIIQDEQRKKGR